LKGRKGKEYLAWKISVKKKEQGGEGDRKKYVGGKVAIPEEAISLLTGRKGGGSNGVLESQMHGSFQKLKKRTRRFKRGVNCKPISASASGWEGR